MKFSEARTSAEKWFTRRPRTLRAPYSHPSSIFCCGMRNRKTALSIGNCSKNGTRQLPTGIWKLPRDTPTDGDNQAQSFQSVSLVSPGPSAGPQEFEFEGDRFRPAPNSHWKTTLD